MSRPRDIGTRAESAIRKVCQASGFPYAERNPLYGAKDRGDLLLTPGVIIESKGGKAAERASDGQIEKWMGELDVAIGNAGAELGLLVTKRAGVGFGNAHRWWAYMRLGDFTGKVPDLGTITRLTLGDALAWLKREGW